MRNVLSGLAVLALAAASASVAVGQTSGSPMMPKCSSATGPVVWMSSSKMYYMKGASQYGKGSGKYVCKATAAKMGGKLGTMKSSMGGGSIGAPSMMPHPMSSPRMMSSPGMMSSPMPSATQGVGIPNGTSAAPGSMGTSPGPMSSMNPSSGNQGNTGAPGAGGQVPNNPASTPNPRPS